MDNIKGKLEQWEKKLQPGDLLVLYSDGIPEAQNKDKKQYGLKKLMEVVEGVGKSNASADATKEAILDEIKKFIGTAPRLDDITVLVFKRKTIK